MGPPTDTGLLNCYLILPQVITSSKCHASWCHHHVHENVDMTTATSLLFQQIYKFSSRISPSQVFTIYGGVLSYLMASISPMAVHRGRCCCWLVHRWTNCSRSVPSPFHADANIAPPENNLLSNKWECEGASENPLPSDSYFVFQIHGIRICHAIAACSVKLRYNYVRGKEIPHNTSFRVSLGLSYLPSHSSQK